MGCTVSIACSSTATAMVHRKPVDEAYRITEQAIAEALGVFPNTGCGAAILPLRLSAMRPGDGAPPEERPSVRSLRCGRHKCPDLLTFYLAKDYNVAGPVDILSVAGCVHGFRQHPETWMGG